MKKLAILSLLLLTACTTVAVPVVPTFPEAPATLQQECETLNHLAAKAKLSDVMITITENYVKYAKCKRQNQAWNEWYTEQKQIFDTAANAKPKKKQVNPFLLKK